MSKKIKDRLLGTIVTLVTGMLSFLVYNYTSSFVTLAQYNKDKGEIVKEMAILRSDTSHIKEKVDDIYSILREH